MTLLKDKQELCPLTSYCVSFIFLIIIIIIIIVFVFVLSWSTFYWMSV